MKKIIAAAVAAVMFSSLGVSGAFATEVPRAEVNASDAAQSGSETGPTGAPSPTSRSTKAVASQAETPTPSPSPDEDKPLTTAIPVIVGTAAFGKTLNVNTGGWTSGTRFEYQWYANNVAVVGATNNAFKIAAAQVGKTITVKVTGSCDGYVTAAETSKATAAVKGSVLITKVPTISGTVQVGKKLTAKTGAWTSGTKPSFQWYVSGKAVKGATGRSFAVPASAKGKKITVKVTGEKAGYVTAARTSKATKAVKAGKLTSVRPELWGYSMVGEYLEVPTPYHWADDTVPGWKGGPQKISWTAGTKLSYQWSADGKAIKGATGAKFKITKAQIGKRVTVTITGRKDGYATTSRTSKVTKKIVKWHSGGGSLNLSTGEYEPVFYPPYNDQVKVPDQAFGGAGCQGTVTYLRSKGWTYKTAKAHYVAHKAEYQCKK